MELLPKDNKVIDLLGQLKKSEEIYPSALFTNRRQQYQKQMMDIEINAGNKKNTPKSGNGNGAAIATISSKIVETILVVVIAAEAGTAAYFYRAKLSEILKALATPTNVQAASAISSKEIDYLNFKLIEATTTPAATLTTATSSNKLLAMPSPTITEKLSNNGVNISITSTPKPNGNNGNHYGQTPKSERIIDNNGGNNNHNSSGNDGNGQNHNNNGDGNNHNGGGNGASHNGKP